MTEERITEANGGNEGSWLGWFTGRFWHSQARLRHGQLVKLVKLALEQPFVGQRGLVLGDESGGDGAGEGVFDDFVVFGGAEEDADGGALVGLADVAVEGLEIEFHFAEMLRFEFLDFQIEGNQALQAPVEEQEVQAKVLAADLEGILLTDETKVAAQFNEEASEFADKRRLKLSLRVAVSKLEKFDHIAILERAFGVWVQLCQRC